MRLRCREILLVIFGELIIYGFLGECWFYAVVSDSNEHISTFEDGIESIGKFN